MAACGNDDPFRTQATFDNTITAVSLSSFSAGTVAPSALDLVNQLLVRPEVQEGGGVNFQLAFDIDGAGQVTLLPVLALLTPPGGATSVGLQRVTSTFDELTRSPTGGFVRDTAQRTAPGDVWLLQVQSGRCIYGEPWYGKLQVESVDVAARWIVVRYLINRNCGYRDLTIGLPRN